jgi:hypothetical protein
MPPTIVALTFQPAPDPRLAALARTVAVVVGELCPAAVVLELELTGGVGLGAAAEALAGASVVVAAAAREGDADGLERLPRGALRGTLAVPVAVGDGTATALRTGLVRLGATCPTATLALAEAELDDAGAAITPWLERDARVLWATLRRSLLP